MTNAYIEKELSELRERARTEYIAGNVAIAELFERLVESLLENKRLTRIIEYGVYYD